MQLVRHWLLATFVLLISAAGVQAQAPVAPAEGESELLVFLNGAQVGREQARVSRVAGNWIIASTGSYGAPLNLKVNRFEVRYTPDWQPVELHVNAVQGSRVLELSTSFSVTNAINEITQAGVTNSKTDQISARTIVLPNNFYAGYEALAARLASITPPAELPVYVAPQTEIRVTVQSVTREQIQTPTGTVTTRRYDLTFNNPGGALQAKVTIDDRSRLVRLELPAASLLVVRADLATVSTRAQTTKNPTDVDVRIPATGFTIGGTITTPTAPGTLRHPAVVLVAGSGPVGRDETVAGIPIFAQLAGALAEREMVVLRYDKRGVGQSGGRTESATLQDFADDLVAIVKWMAKRKDVDPKRIAVVGHSEGAAVAMLAAAREQKIASLVLVAGTGTTGAELILEQQSHQLDLMKASPEERQQKVELQKKIQAAVMTEKGWEGIPPELRRQADSSLFRSLLLFDPAKVMPRVKQPILIVQGDLDKQVPPHHAEKLAALARARKKSPPVELKIVPGINHLLVPAKTGEVAEYPTLPEKTISAEVVSTIAGWLSGRQMQ